MSYVRLVLNSSGTADDFKSESPLSMGGLDAVNNFAAYLVGVVGGNEPGAELAFKVGAVQATATITSTGTAGNGETMKLANETLTAKTTGADPEAGEFDISATVGTQATNIALAINSMPELAGIVTAVANAGVVTVTAVVPGLVGNGIECADVNLANVAVAGFSGGTDGTAYTIDLR